MNKSLRFILLIAILVLCWYLGRFIDVDIERYKELLGRFPLALSGIVFVLLYVLITFFVWFGAKDVFRIASALLYGPYVSGFLVYLGELGNAVVLFFLARKLGQAYVAQKFHLKQEDIEKAKESKGSFGAFALRINPLIPYRLQDLGAGLSAIQFSKYFPAIAVAQIPRIFFFQYVIAGVGMSIFKNPDYAIRYMSEHEEILVLGNLYFLLVVIVTVAYFILKVVRRRRGGS